MSVDIPGKLWALYVNNSARYVRCQDGKVWVPKKKGSEDPANLNRKIIEQHVAGLLNVGVFASERAAKFICFDVDLLDKEVALGVIDTLVGLGFERRDIYPSFSGGKGYHIEIFFDAPVAHHVLRKLYDGVIQAGGFDPRKVEFRPTPTQAVRLPLSQHYKTGAVGWYCDVNTLEPIERQDYIYEIRPVLRKTVDEISDRIKIVKPKKKKRAAIRRDLGDALTSMPTITEPHTRHMLMLRIARWLRQRGDGEQDIFEKLMAWVAEQDHELIGSTDEEIEDDAANIAKWAAGLVVEAGADPARPFGRDIFDAADLNYVLNGRNKTERRILFRSVLARKIFGKDRVAQRLIAFLLGISTVGVRSAIERLKERGLLVSTPGVGGKKGAGRFFHTSNTYAPGDGVEQVLDEQDLAAKYWGPGERLEWKHLLWYYAGMLNEMLGPNMKKYIGAAETKDVQRLLAEVMDDSAIDGDDACGSKRSDGV